MDATRPDRRHWIRRVGGACGAIAAATLTPPARARQGGSAAPTFYDHFSGMRLLDQGGQAFQMPALKGRVVLINFIFTACSTVCPVQTHALAQMQRQMTPDLRRRVHLLSVSLDALSDTPQTLRAFAARYQVDHAGWSFVTGRPGDIQRLADSLRLFRDGRGDGKGDGTTKGKASPPLEDHITSLWLLDAQGVMRTRYSGNPPDTGRLIRELAVLADLTVTDKPGGVGGRAEGAAEARTTGTR